MDCVSIPEEKAFNNLLVTIPENKYKRVVTTGRGGLTIAQRIAYKLGLPVVQDPSKFFLGDLFVDDIACTGQTLADLPAYVDAAVLVWRSGTSLRPNYFGLVYKGTEYIKFSWEGDKPVNSFKDERSKVGDGADRYGKDIINNFDPEKDLVFWDLQKRYTKNGYWVTMIHPEISALCPVSGYPDSGKVTVEFKPNNHTVELKAFKLWINSFRNVSISHEDLANEIYNTLAKGLKAQELYVKLEMMPRGNVTTIVEVGDSFATCLKKGK